MLRAILILLLIACPAAAENYLPQATLALGLARSAAQCKALGCDGTLLFTSADTPSGNVLSFSDTTGLSVGQLVRGGSQIPRNTTIASLTSTTVTLSNPVLSDLPTSSPVGFGLTVLWWQVQPLTDNSAAIRIDPGTRFDTSDRGIGLSGAEISTILSKVATGTKLPFILPLSTFTSRLTAGQQTAVVNSTNPAISTGWALIQSTGGSNATRTVDLSNPILQTMLGAMLADGIVTNAQYNAAAAYIAVAVPPL